MVSNPRFANLSKGQSLPQATLQAAIAQVRFSIRAVGFISLLILLGLTACGEKTPVGSSQADEAKVIPTPPEQLKLYVFHGGIGNYNTDALMNLVFEGDTVLGSYYYYKNLGRLALNGNIDPMTNQVTLVESYNGKQTGYFKGTFGEQGLSGRWSASPDFGKSQAFGLEILKVIEVGTKPSIKHSNAKYALEHNIEMWDSEAKDFEQFSTTDDIVIRFIDDEAFSFHYEVTGHNGHQGQLAGIGKMLNLKQGIFTIEECELLFDFYDKKVDITSTNCQDFTGARAHFGGSLTRM